MSATTQDRTKPPALSAARQRSQNLAGDIVATPVLAVSAVTPLGDVLLVMLRMGRRHAVVLDPHGGCLGIVGDRAVAAAWARDPSSSARMLAGQLIGAKPSLVGPRASIQDVAAVMVRDQVDAVAVIDGAGRPLGIVTDSDLVALMARACFPGPTATASIPE